MRHVLAARPLVAGGRAPGASPDRPAYRTQRRGRAAVGDRPGSRPGPGRGVEQIAAHRRTWADRRARPPTPSVRTLGRRPAPDRGEPADATERDLGGTGCG